jgi:hypothetical protein
VIVIWPIIISGGVGVGDSLTFIEVLKLNDGVDEIDLNELFTAYPNPTSQDLHLKNNSKSAIEEVRIYDMRGRLVGNQENSDRLCTDNWPKGMYLLQITTRDKRSCTLRVIKQ